MERNTKTSFYQLQPGDRFYKCTDKNKSVYEKIAHEPKKTKYRTYSHWAIETRHFITSPNAWQIEKFAVAISGDTEVVFLRHNYDHQKLQNA